MFIIGSENKYCACETSFLPESRVASTLLMFALTHREQTTFKQERASRGLSGSDIRAQSSQWTSFVTEKLPFGTRLALSCWLILPREIFQSANSTTKDVSVNHTLNLFAMLGSLKVFQM